MLYGSDQPEQSSSVRLPRLSGSLHIPHSTQMDDERSNHESCDAKPKFPCEN